MFKNKRLNAIIVLGILSVVAVACAQVTTPTSTEGLPEQNPTDRSSETEPSPTHTEEDQACGDPLEDVEIFFRQAFWIGKTNFCEHSVDLSEIFTGNPVPDAIPAIDRPDFENVEDADIWLGDDWPVMFFEIEDDVRAYPLAILIWHEIVNDVVADEPVAITFCPLCNATIAFRRTLDDGQVVDFGTSGNLRNSDLIMYDGRSDRRRPDRHSA
jgi:hypothetical protein